MIAYIQLVGLAIEAKIRVHCEVRLLGAGLHDNCQLPVTFRGQLAEYLIPQPELPRQVAEAVPVLGPASVEVNRPVLSPLKYLHMQMISRKKSFRRISKREKWNSRFVESGHF